MYKLNISFWANDYTAQDVCAECKIVHNAWYYRENTVWLTVDVILSN